MAEFTRVAETKDRLQEAMRDEGLNNNELAEKTGIHRATIGKYVAGGIEPRREAVHKIAVALNVAEMWLYGYDVPKTRDAEKRKNDALVGIVKKLRSDPDFMDVVSLLAELPTREYISVKQIILSLGEK